MSAPRRARALVGTTVALGACALAAAVHEVASTPLALVSLLAAAAVVAELFQVESDESSLDPVDTQTFSFSSAVHLAAVLVAGPWAAGLVAAFGVLTVDFLRRRPPRKVVFNACAFALVTVVAGSAFQLLGGTPGTLSLPADLPAVLVLAAVYTALNTALISSVVAFHASAPAWPLVRATLPAELPTAAAEASLGLVLAFLALTTPWAAAALVPLLLAVYQAHARLAEMRRETARALETFANVVDERDPYTFRHSLRVAEYVRELAEALGLAPGDVARLRWAGRLHDLGKVAVDSDVLLKPGRLDPTEWAAVRRHPRLSARLLGRFRLAREEARAVEFHHERYDGNGYYGVGADRLPLASHFLIVADSFDAMTADRPYRAGLPEEEALAEIERHLGGQFHPAVGRAFVALRRGQALDGALGPAELRELRRPFARRTFDARALLRRDGGELATLAGIVLVLAGGAFGSLAPAAAGAALVAAGLVARRLFLVRARSLRRRLLEALAAGSPQAALASLAAGLAEGTGLRWAGVLRWSAAELDGDLELEWGNRLAAPPEAVLVSWLVRETEAVSDLVRTPGAELGRDGVFVAVPLRGESGPDAFLVLAFAHETPGHVAAALADVRPAVGVALGLAGRAPDGTAVAV